MYETVALLAASKMVGFCYDPWRNRFTCHFYPGRILDNHPWYIVDPCRHILSVGGGCNENHVYPGAGLYDPLAAKAQKARYNKIESEIKGR